MKRIFTLFALIGLFTGYTSAQNLLAGGNMESADEGSWYVTILSSTEANTSEYQFGYTDDAPFAGDGACLHYVINNTGADGAHLMFYQPVTIEKGKKYIADMAAKALQPMNNSWFEVYIGADEPADGADYGSGATPLGGFKWSGWEAGCADLDEFDGTLRVDGCMAHSQDTIYIEGEGTVDLFFGFKAGIWATETTVEFVVDNVTLVEANGSKVNESEASAVVYPNPANNLLNINSVNEITRLQIINVLGQEVLNQANPSNTIDISALENGIYIVKLTNVNNQISLINLRKN